MQTRQKPTALGRASEALRPLPFGSPLTCPCPPPPPAAPAFPGIPTSAAWRELDVQPQCGFLGGTWNSAAAPGASLAAPQRATRMTQQFRS